MHTFTALGRKIRKSRERQNITLNALAGSTGIWITRLKAIEAGQPELFLTDLQKLSTALKLTITIRP